MSVIFRVLRYISWPVVAGLLAAALFMLLLPETLNNAAKMETRGLSPGVSGEWQGPASYAAAVQRASASVVNIYTRKTLERPRHPLLDDPFFRRFFSNSNCLLYTSPSPRD